MGDLIISSSVHMPDSSLVLALRPRPAPGLGTENDVPAPAPHINVGRIEQENVVLWRVKGAVMARLEPRRTF